MLGYFMKRFLHIGTLTVIWPSGRPEIFGQGEPHATIRLHDCRAVLALAVNPDLKLGELYMEGRVSVENGDIRDVLALGMMNIGMLPPRGGVRGLVHRLRMFSRRLSQFNPARRARVHVAHHYDLDARLYDLFLGRDMQYSCAYFSAPDETLEEAQVGKKRHIAAKLNLNRPGLRVLDIGCGWGGLALNLARDCGADVLGVTLSHEQLVAARRRAERAALAARCRFELVDYRALGGRYDRIVSVGMFEHVGVPYYGSFFAKVRDLLADEGVMLLHTIGRLEGPGSTNPWIAKYIFPGGYTPALSEVTSAIERAGLVIADVEVLRLHYAQTLIEWQKRFRTNRDRIRDIYDERFCRMWEFYLASAEMSFRYNGQVVFQIQIVKNIHALPVTRDYMLDAERTMKFAGTRAMPRSLRAV